MRTLDDMVRMEVMHVASSLVHTLAQGYWGLTLNAEAREVGGDLVGLTEQAMELSTPIQDYEEAAIQEGWTHEVARFTGAPWFVHPEHGRHDFESWEDLCSDQGIDPYDREIFEHWIITDWLADRLAERGEKVDKDFAGLTIWARTTTGQAISMDGVIEDIYNATHRRD